MAINNMKIALIIVAALLSLTACSGYRYSMIEDNNAYFLKGEFYNNNPFIKVKAIIPNCYLVKKTQNKTALRDDIKSTDNYGTKIIEGVIIDKETAVEIKLTVHDPATNQDRPARENGMYTLTTRQHVDNLNVYLEKNKKERLKP